MKKHTPGTWKWFRRSDGQVYLAAPHSGHLTVMDFVRKGFNSAQPRFATWKNSQREQMGGIMVPADSLVVDIHPDAMLIQAAPTLIEACRKAIKDLRETGSVSSLTEYHLHNAVYGATGEIP